MRGVLLLLLAAALAALTNGMFGAEEKKKILKDVMLERHNFARSLHDKTGPMTWDSAMAAEAQKYCDKLATVINSKIYHEDLVHSTHIPGGENLGWRWYYRKYDAGSDREGKYFKKSITKSFKSWYQENLAYPWKHPYYSDWWGHFTQIVWKRKGEAKLGCGATIKREKFKEDHNHIGTSTYLCCNYLPSSGGGGLAENVGKIIKCYDDANGLCAKGSRCVTPGETCADGSLPDVPGKKYCEDRYDGCASWKNDDGYCKPGHRYFTWMGNNCAGSCESCDEEEEGEILATCTAGNYMTSTGCQQCSENTFSGDGATRCKSCPYGKVSDVGSTKAGDCYYAPCNAGSYMTSAGCKQCPENTFSGDGATSCENCPDGKVSDVGSTSADDCYYAQCNAGSHMTSTGCKQCPENTFSRNGATSCESCPDGRASGVGSTSAVDCYYGWLPLPVGKKDTLIVHDLDATPLQIKTESDCGSGDLMWVQFLDKNRDGSGIKVIFTKPPTYKIGFCEKLTSFTMPQGQVKTWTITKPDTGTISLQCNGEEIFNYKFADSSDNDCETQWGLKKTYIRFKGDDTASVGYRAQPHGYKEQ